MSRVGKQPIVLPEGVEVGVSGDQVTVKGPKGVLELTFRADRIRVEVDSGEARVERDSEEQESLALHGLTRSLIANAVTGVTVGFSKNLEVHGVGFRVEVSRVLDGGWPRCRCRPTGRSSPSTTPRSCTRC